MIRHLSKAAALWIAALVVGLMVSVAAGPVEGASKRQIRKEQAEAIAALPLPYREWIEQVAPIISDGEREAFLKLEQDYQRDAFIDRFWRARDPYPDTARNEFKQRWDERLAEVRVRFERPNDERAETLLTQGPPADIMVAQCGTLLWPTELWFYVGGSDQVRYDFFVVFYQRWGNGPYRRWEPGEGIEVLVQEAELGFGGRGNANVVLGRILNECLRGEVVAGVIGNIMNQGLGYLSTLADLDEAPEVPEAEWVATFEAYSTDVPAEAGVLDGRLELSFPGRRQNRTVTQGVVSLPVEQLGMAELAEHRSYNFVLTGEVLSEEGELFDTFRYKFDALPAQVQGDRLPLVFQRYLRPGGYRLVFKLEDLNGGKFYRVDQHIDVPAVEAAPPPPPDPETARLLAEANAVLATGEVTLRIVEPAGQLLSGMHRFDTLITGDPSEVVFKLDGKPILTKKTPPFSVELDLGDLPRPRTLRVSALDEQGRELAVDERLINAVGHTFRVRLVEPSRGATYRESLRARVEVEVPEGSAVERVELLLNEDVVATLYEPPYVQPIVLPSSEFVGYVQAVAYLTDGNTTQDLVFVNAPGLGDEINIEYVELYASVFDRDGRPLRALGREQFSVTEDGVAQTIQRFEHVEDLPIHAAVLMDVSASMEGRLADTRDAALRFFEQTIRDKDRAAVITFNDRPTLAVQFTSQLRELGGALAGLKAERGTALYDSLIFSLYYFSGIKGQRALLVLSDGQDASSRFEFEDALEYARRAGVTIYSIGLDLDKGEARRKLTKLAEETGGRSFFVESPAELDAIYRQIEEELRSQYLITYQSTNTSADAGFRSIEVETAERGLNVSTLKGYYP
jgi:Ca-activated chloride channel family protein